jgi:hypothetical protein
MKKMILLLLFPIFCYSQNDDKVNQAMVDVIIKQKVDNSAVRDLLIDELDKIKSKTNSEILKKKCDDHIVFLKKKSVAESVKVDLNKASKEDLKKFYVSKDKFTNATTIIRKKTDGDRLRLHISVNENNNAFLILTTTYNSKDWLFTSNVTVLVDNETFYYSFDDPDRKVNSTATVTEKSYVYCNKNHLEIISKIINTIGAVDLRFTGDKGNHDYTLLKSTIEDLRAVYELYLKIKV